LDAAVQKPQFIAGTLLGMDTTYFEFFASVLGLLIAALGVWFAGKRAFG
jgi:hypothetical protein